MASNNKDDNPNVKLYHINPYELLNLTPKSTLEEAKKAYYALSLLCHPDKGGRSEDMVILSNCYKYIKTQLAVLDDKKDITYEGLEEEFADFCKEQKNKKPPTFCNIYKETSGYDECTNDNSLSDLNPPEPRHDYTNDPEYIARVTKFNLEFNVAFEKSKQEDIKQNGMPAMDEGYGKYMDKKTITTLNDNNVNDINYEEISKLDINDKSKHNFTQEIMEYKEPQSIPDMVIHFPLKAKHINDYSSQTGNNNHGLNNNNKLDMTDYKKAFSPKKEIKVNNELLNQSPMERYEAELKERQYSS